MEEWFSNLPAELADSLIWLLLLEAAKQAYQKLPEGSYGRDIRVTLTDRVGVSDDIPDKLPAAEDLLWWYVHIRLS